MAILNGTKFSDHITGSSGDDLIDGGAGNDVIHGGGGQDQIFGGDGDDTMYSDNGFVSFYGGYGDNTADFSGRPAGVHADLSLEKVGYGGFGGINILSHTWFDLDDIRNLNGSNSSDFLHGDWQDNVLRGNGGDDYIDGDSGNDTVEGGAGADQMHGGWGLDTLSYEHSSAGVWVSLGNGIALKGDAQGDTFDGFENLTGSAHDDLLCGDAGANVIRGGAGTDIISGEPALAGSAGGNDTIEGGAGADIMNGGAGINTLSYENSFGGVSVSLLTGTALDHDAAGDTFLNFQNLTGSAFDDNLNGDNGANVIEGLAGNDTLWGWSGADTFVFNRDYVGVVEFGKDTIGDFAVGQDHLQFDHTIFADFASVQSHMKQVGADTVITYDAANTITLQNVQMANLHAGDFLFV